MSVCLFHCLFSGLNVCIFAYLKLLEGMKNVSLVANRNVSDSTAKIRTDKKKKKKLKKNEILPSKLSGIRRHIGLELKWTRYLYVWKCMCSVYLKIY